MKLVDPLMENNIENPAVGASRQKLMRTK
jgi:hypothetical protein